MGNRLTNSVYQVGDIAPSGPLFYKFSHISAKELSFVGLMKVKAIVSNWFPDIIIPVYSLVLLPYIQPK